MAFPVIPAIGLAISAAGTALAQKRARDQMQQNQNLATQGMATGQMNKLQGIGAQPIQSMTGNLFQPSNAPAGPGGGSPMDIAKAQGLAQGGGDPMSGGGGGMPSAAGSAAAPVLGAAVKAVGGLVGTDPGTTVADNAMNGVNDTSNIFPVSMTDDLAGQSTGMDSMGPSDTSVWNVNNMFSDNDLAENAKTWGTSDTSVGNPGGTPPIGAGPQAPSDWSQLGKQLLAKAGMSVVNPVAQGVGKLLFDKVAKPRPPNTRFFNRGR